MASLNLDEVAAGTVVQLDVHALRLSGQSKTNAEITETEDRTVEGEHSFLILQVNLDRDTAFLTPIFSEWAPGSEEFKEDRKSGYANLWLGVVLFFNHWQHWEIPLDELVQHSGGELASVNNRRKYAAADPKELQRILNFSKSNRAPWRRVAPNN